MDRLVWLGSLVAIVTATLVGCKREMPPSVQPSSPPVASTESDEHHHHDAGPHGGTIIDWGGGAYHVEFTVDHDKKEATVYILGTDGKSAAPVKAEKLQLDIKDPSFQLDLTAQPLEGEGEGMSSRFVGQHDNLGIVRDFEGMISGEVEGTPYVGEFNEVADGHKH